MIQSLLIGADAAESVRAQELFVLDDQLLDLVSGAATYCPSGEYHLTSEIGQGGQPKNTRIDCD